MKINYKPESLKRKKELQKQADKIRLQLISLKEMKSAEGVDRKDIENLIKEKRKEYSDLNHRITQIKKGAVETSLSHEKRKARINEKIVQLLHKRVGGKAFDRLKAEALEEIRIEDM